MIIGAALLVITLVMRGATVNRYVRSRLAISAALFAAYAGASALIAYGPLPASAVNQLHTATPLFLAFGLANASRVRARERGRGGGDQPVARRPHPRALPQHRPGRDRHRAVRPRGDALPSRQ